MIIQKKFILSITALIVTFFTIFILSKDSGKFIALYWPKLDQYYNSYDPPPLKKDLESGKIIIFGSSELRNTSLKFMPINFFKRHNLPIAVLGEAGHQEFVIMSELAALYNQKSKKNAKIIIMLSPGWFVGSHAYNGTNISRFTKYMSPKMMYELNHKSEVNYRYKSLINNYLKTDKLAYIKSSIFKHINLLPSSINDDIVSSDRTYYTKPNINYDVLFEKAKNISKKASSNNSYGIRNDIFIEEIQPKMKNGGFDISLKKVYMPENSREYKDFLSLLSLLKAYDNKPLFIMQDYHPDLVTKNRGEIVPLLTLIEKNIKKNGFGYMNMWTYERQKYENGNLEDGGHLGELGWLKVNKKIIEYFILNQERK